VAYDLYCGGIRLKAKLRSTFPVLAAPAACCCKFTEAEFMKVHFLLFSAFRFLYAIYNTKENSLLRLLSQFRPRIRPQSAGICMKYLYSNNRQYANDARHAVPKQDFK
jgi:hypothetical protein